MTGLNIDERVTIVSKKIGRYASFPTLTVVGDEVWLACRKGDVSNKTPHGNNGRVCLYYSKISDLLNWERVPLVFNQIQTNNNELDAIITSSIEKDLYVQSRHFLPGNNHPYFGRISKDDLDMARHGRRPIIAERDSLHENMKRNQQPIKIYATFGHSHFCGGRLLQSCYGLIDGQQKASPVVLGSDDEGINWYLHSKIACSDKFGSYLNETSLLETSSGRWMAVIRTDDGSFPLYYSFSNSTADKWEEPMHTGLYGHAPMLVRGKGEEVLLLYREIVNQRPYLSLARNIGDTWECLGKIASYTNIYNGGYGDIVYLGNSRFFVVSYFDDEDESPWIDGFIIEIRG